MHDCWLTVWFVYIVLVWVVSVVPNEREGVFTKSVLDVRHKTWQLPFKCLKSFSITLNVWDGFRKKCLNLKRNFFVITIRDKQYISLLFPSIYICIVQLLKMSLLVIKNYKNVFFCVKVQRLYNSGKGCDSKLRPTTIKLWNHNDIRYC